MTEPYQSYKIEGKYCDLILIYTSGYESWGHFTVDPTNGHAFSTLGKPMTHNCKYTLSHSNYYGSEEISIINITSRKQLLIDINNCTTSGTKYINGSYYVKLKYIGAKKKNFLFKNKIDYNQRYV